MENLLRPRLSSANRVQKKPTQGTSGLLDRKFQPNVPSEPIPQKDSVKSRNVFQDLSHNPSQTPKITQPIQKGSKLAFTLYEDEEEIELCHKIEEKVNPDIPLVFRDQNKNLVEATLCLEDNFDKIVSSFIYPPMSKQTFNKRQKKMERLEAELFKEM
jgi:hypothetical protein